ncbi:MAG: cytochrome c [Desulfuromonas sp.]|jgi:cytochrome c5|nr:MAG: cytochrome c [Desulfuromonas sp.]
MKKRDILLLIGALAIILFLVAAPDETTTRVPSDETHQRFYSLVKEEGKKAAEKFCEDCHNEEQVAFPKDHPPKFRCLFCHKLEQ